MLIRKLLTLVALIIALPVQAARLAQQRIRFRGQGQSMLSDRRWSERIAQGAI
jgi:hypothetical protein